MPNSKLWVVLEERGVRDHDSFDSHRVDPEQTALIGTVMVPCCAVVIGFSSCALFDHVLERGCRCDPVVQQLLASG
jgi:hypothetical protein